MKFSKAILFLLYFIPGLSLAQSSTMQWENYVHGLNITSMAEDAGALYFGTKAGLLKLNKSTNVTTFYNKANSMLPSNQVEALQVTASGDIWVGTYDAGIAIIRGNEWEILNEENSQLPSNSVIAILRDAQERLWIGTNKGMAIVDGNNWIIEDDELNFKWGMGSMAVDESRGDAWYTVSHSAFQFDGSNFIEHGNELQSYGIQSVTVDGNNDVWILSSSKLSQYNGSNWTHYNSGDLPGSSAFNDMKIDKDGHLVVLRNNMLLTKTATGWETETITNIPSSYLTDLNFDKAGNLWLSDGENIYHKEGGNWLSINFSTTPLSRNYIKHVALGKDGELYLIEFNGKLASFKDGKFNVITIPSAFSSTNETEMAVLPDGRLVVATETAGLFFYDGKDWEQMNTSNSNLPSDEIWAMAVSTTGDIFLGNSYNGLMHYDGENWTSYTTSNSILPHNTVHTITAGPAGEIWAATNDPFLTRFKDGEITNFSTSSIGGSSNYIWSLQTSDNGDVWIGSATNPLTRFDGQHFEQFPTGMTVDSKRLKTLALAGTKIWAGTEDKGVLSFDMKTAQYEHFDYAHSPLTGDNVNDFAYDGDGKLYIATAKALHDGVGGLTILKMGTVSGIKSKNREEEQSFILYPNPASDVVYIQISQFTKTGGGINILNYLGQIVKRLDINSSEAIPVNVADLERGLYFICILDGSNRAVKKLLVE